MISLRQLITGAGAFLAASSFAQDAVTNSYVHEQSDANGYVWPTEEAVLKKLDNWQDQKYGVLFHWGLYSLPGICESWPLCDEDWITRPNDCNYEGYKKWYWGLAEALNPSEFNPEQWADIMKKGGMKYMVFTTKHHDGFCTFDSKLTDFTIAKGPFAYSPRKNVAKEVFNAFRDKDFMIGCYFSKPDWHTQWFWNDAYATKGRHINYSKERHPDWWKNYQDYTAGQLGELLGGEYGRFDILWLDGGWITGDDIKLDSILVSARGGLHPGLISVDRAIKGRNENYQTPERGIPATQLNYPWESCIPLTGAWGWVHNPNPMSPNKVVGMLAEITAKGGSLLLGVGPTPLGTIEPVIANVVTNVGSWLDKNGEAIYSTRNAKLYNDGKTWFTANKDGKTLYAIYAKADGETLPSTIEWTGNGPEGKMTHLGTGKNVRYTVSPEGKVTVSLPKGLPDMPVALKFTAKK